MKWMLWLDFVEVGFGLSGLRSVCFCVFVYGGDSGLEVSFGRSKM